jgi:uncharacterized cysteine cluster protein YcgN (CxxCxxCC family)
MNGTACERHEGPLLLPNQLGLQSWQCCLVDFDFKGSKECLQLTDGAVHKLHWLAGFEQLLENL